MVSAGKEREREVPGELLTRKQYENNSLRIIIFVDYLVLGFCVSHIFVAEGVVRVRG